MAELAQTTERTVAESLRQSLQQERDRAEAMAREMEIRATHHNDECQLDEKCQPGRPASQCRQTGSYDRSRRNGTAAGHGSTGKPGGGEVDRGARPRTARSGKYRRGADRA